MTAERERSGPCGPEPLGLSGRVAVVVGAAPGMGLACADALSSVGARVACIDIDPEVAERSAASISERGDTAIAVAADARERSSVAAAFDDVENRLGPVDAIVNIVGVGGHGAVVDTDDGEWDRIVDLNLRQQFVVAREAVRRMGTRRRGSVVLLSSINGVTSSPYNGAYGAAKAGLVSLTRSLAVEVGPLGIRVNCVAPGATRTPRLAHLFDGELGARYAQIIPLGRPNEPSEIAAAVLFLLSDWASAITGQVLVVDGGASCNYPLLTKPSAGP